MNNTILGRYMPYNTFIHRLDARSKILALIFLMIPIFLSFPNPATSFLVYALIAVVFYILMRISKIRFRMVLTQLKALWIMMIFILRINILMIKDPIYGFISIGNSGFTITLKAIFDTLFVVIRLGLVVVLTTILTATTKPLDLTFALEWYLTPLKKIGLPANVIAMTISLALRFIPTFLEDTERIMKAQSSRGVDFENGKFLEKIRAMISLIVPLLSSALQKSDDLANALEARGYDPDAKRTHYRIRKWKFADTVTIIVSLLFLGAIISASILKLDVLVIFMGVI